MASPQIIIILGRQGCGKGTQAELLVKKFGLIYIGSGELLRELAAKSNFSGRKTAQTTKTGVLVPTSLIFQLWINKLEEIKQTKDNDLAGIIFDGSPRKLVEANLLDEALNWYEWNKNIKVLLIDISRREAVDRLTKRRICKKCGQSIPYIGYYKDLVNCGQCGGELETRADDTPEAIDKRLDLFEEEVMPVVDFYEKRGLVIKINGEQAIEEVHQEILTKLK